MEKNDLIFIVLVSVIAIIIASFMIPLWVKAPQNEPGKQPEPPQPPQTPAPLHAQQPSVQLKTVISFINIGLIIPLFIIYAGIYRRLKSSFTLGLMAVILALGMYAVFSNPLIVSLLGGHVADIGVFQIVPDLFATVALIILVRISLE
jgi:small-conductance mechanosensitive channel